MGTADIRVSDDERGAAVSMLGVHLSTGRIELDEYEDRLRLATEARTRGELEALFTDLPAPHPDLSSSLPPGQLIQKAGQLVSAPTGKKNELVETPLSKALEIVAGISFLFGLPAAILLTVFDGQWWVFIPVGLVLIVAGALADEAKKQPPGES